MCSLSVLEDTVSFRCLSGLFYSRDHEFYRYSRDLSEEKNVFALIKYMYNNKNGLNVFCSFFPLPPGLKDKNRFANINYLINYVYLLPIHKYLFSIIGMDKSNHKKVWIEKLLKHCSAQNNVENLAWKQKENPPTCISQKN